MFTCWYVYSSFVLLVGYFPLLLLPFSPTSPHLFCPLPSSLFSHSPCPLSLALALLSQLQIWDTAGMEQFRNALVTKYYRNADGILFVYDLTRHKTFENLEHWINEVKTYVGFSSVKMTVIGNKLDQSVKREVSSEEGQALADKYGMTFYELSAKDPKQLTKLEEIFSILAHEMLERREEQDLTRSQSGIIRLGQASQVPDEWVMVSAPEGPIPRSTYYPQEMKVRMRAFLPRGGRSGSAAGRRRGQNSRGSCSCL